MISFIIGKKKRIVIVNDVLMMIELHVRVPLKVTQCNKFHFYSTATALLFLHSLFFYDEVGLVFIVIIN